MIIANTELENSTKQHKELLECNSSRRRWRTNIFMDLFVHTSPLYCYYCYSNNDNDVQTGDEDGIEGQLIKLPNRDKPKISVLEFMKMRTCVFDSVRGCCFLYKKRRSVHYSFVCKCKRRKKTDSDRVQSSLASSKAMNNSSNSIGHLHSWLFTTNLFSTIGWLVVVTITNVAVLWTRFGSHKLAYEVRGQIWQSSTVFFESPVDLVIQPWDLI